MMDNDSVVSVVRAHFEPSPDAADCVRLADIARVVGNATRQPVTLSMFEALRQALAKYQIETQDGLSRVLGMRRRQRERSSFNEAQ